MALHFSSGERFPSTLLSPGYSLIDEYADSTLAKVTSDIGGPAIDSLTTFVMQLQETDLTVCSPDEFVDMNEGKAIGRGTTMTVFKCLWKSKNKAVAVKRINLGIPLSTSTLDVHEEEYQGLLKSLLLEVRVMNHPWFKAHPNFVDLFGVLWDQTPGDNEISSHRPSLVVELADQTTSTLKDFIAHQKNNLTEAESRLVFDLLTDVAEGMTMLHAAKIVHGDLKPENVLLFPAPRRLVAKLSDFGFSSPFVESRDRIGGTAYWNAPECMSNAPPNIKPFAKTLTRDIYSFGLVMWFCLFETMPFGPENSAREDEVSKWKLRQDHNIQLRENIITRSSGLCNLQSPTRKELILDTRMPDELLWFQIWAAMAEMLKLEPNSRNISLGEIHLVMKTPQRQVERPEFMVPGADASRSNNGSGIAFVRPSQVAGMNEALRTRSTSKYDAYGLMHLPLQLQKYLFEDWTNKWNEADKSKPEFVDLLMIMASCYRTGFGGEKNLGKARELEIEAATHGSDVGQIISLTYGLLDGFDPTFISQQKIPWLREAVTTIFFRKRPDINEAQVAEEQSRMVQFCAAIDAIADEWSELSLFHSFINSYMTWWEILNGDFDGAAQDPLFCFAIDGDISKLTAAIDSDSDWGSRRKDGFTLLHVAVDYCQEQVVRKLIQEYDVSPNIESDFGQTPIELAALTGSVACLQLLLSLGADPTPLANQELFTEITMSGSRDSPGHSTAMGNRTLMSIFTSIIRLLHADGHRPGDPDAAIQDLLNGRYQNSIDDGDLCGSPLEVCLGLSKTNYDSLFALLQLGADPNSYNDTPSLHIAVSLREPCLVALLLAYGADPNLRTGKYGCQDTALHQADMTSMILLNNPPRNEITTYEEIKAKGVVAVDTENKSAIEARTRACIDVLLSFGADIEAQDEDGNTPLMRRIVEGDLETGDYLLRKGANLHAKDFAGFDSIAKTECPESLAWYASKTQTEGRDFR